MDLKFRFDLIHRIIYTIRIARIASKTHDLSLRDKLRHVEKNIDMIFHRFGAATSRVVNRYKSINPHKFDNNRTGIKQITCKRETNKINVK